MRVKIIYNRGGTKKRIYNLLLISLFIFCLNCASASPRITGERIVYAISPVGVSEYSDLGPSEVKGRPFNLATFKTQAMGFRDTEKIYTDPQTDLPVRVERDLSMWGDREKLVEEYDQKKFELTIKKYKGKKKVKEYFFKADGPIHNAVLLPFFLRKVKKLQPGWTFIVRFPAKFTVRLVGIEEIRVPAGKFMAYHFTSVPHKFEIWISQDSSRVPLKIKGMEGLKYTLSLKERTLK